MKKIHLLCGLLLLLPPLYRINAQSLEQDFKTPPADTRPGCYWYWINDNISKEGITKDLEAMARVGIGRAYLGHIYIFNNNTSDTPVGSVKFMSDAWWDALQWAVREADRCGVEIGFFNSPGWSQSGGPWIKPSQSMRYLAASQTRITGGGRISIPLPAPDIHTAPVAGGAQPITYAPKFTAKDFQDVSVIAVPALTQPAPIISSLRINGKVEKADSPFDLSGIPVAIDIALQNPAIVQFVSLTPDAPRSDIQASVQVSTDGITYRDLTKYNERRGHQGARNEDPILIPLPPTESGRIGYIRLTISSTPNAPRNTNLGKTRITKLSLGAEPRIGHYVRKQLGETDPARLPAWDSYRWITQPAVLAGTAIASKQVINLSQYVDRNGVLNWDAPPGDWTVMRIGMVPLGTSCAPASPEARGLEVDKMSKAHIRAHFDAMMGEFLKRTPAAERRALKYVIADSYETGPQNWTDGFAAKFERRFGYSPIPWLPCIEGLVVDSPEASDRFLWDWRRLIAESIAEDYVGGLREVSREHGLTLWLENYGHWGFPSEFLLYGSKSNQVGGEFWENEDPTFSTQCRSAASSAHTYGRRDVYAEAFTSRRNFKQSPGEMKPLLDWAYSSGVNHIILHVNIHQPDERKPGIMQWFGTAFDRHDTLFEQSRAFIDYIRRSAVMLKAGRPVVDVAYYIGESSPVMTGPLDPALPDGYDYDHINADVLINRAKVVDGRIAIENGPQYELLVLPPERTMTPEVLGAIKRLVEAGATILGNAPETSPSLAGYPEADRNVRMLAVTLWGESSAPIEADRKVGKGRVLSGMTLEQAFAKIGVEADLQIIGADNLLCAAAGNGKIGLGEKGGIVFKHRHTGAQEIYFLANTSNKTATFTASFRSGGQRPSLWNAVTGELIPAQAFAQRKGRTQLPIQLVASESIYVVFDQSIDPDVVGSAQSNSPMTTPLATLKGPWAVSFDGVGAPQPITMESLVDLSRHENPGIRAFSGTTIYQTTVQFDQIPQGRAVKIDLGLVCSIASVSVNGIELGTAWCAPWQVDIRKALKAGPNSISIRVANTWNNRLISDAELTEDKRVSYVSQPYAKGQLMPAGLLGPVRIMTNQTP